MVKGPQRNAQFFYMTEVVMKRYPNQQLSFKEALSIGNPEWKRMTTEQRLPYKEMERKHKAKMRGAEGDIYRKINTGENKAVYKEQQEKVKRLEEQWELSAKAYIPSDVTSRNRHVIYIIDFEYMVVTDKKEYYPAEICIIRYSIDAGIQEKVFTYLFYYDAETHRLPYAMYAEAKTHSELYHGIPVFPDDDFIVQYKPQCNIVALYSIMLAYLDPEKSGIIPPLFCRPDKLADVRGCMEWMFRRSESNIKVDVIVTADFAVSKFLESAFVSLSKKQLEERLERPMHNFDEDTLCQYHAAIDKGCCARAHAKCVAYAISELCCPQLRVPMTRKHTPIAEKVVKKPLWEEPPPVATGWTEVEVKKPASVKKQPTTTAPWASSSGWGSSSASALHDDWGQSQNVVSNGWGKPTPSAHADDLSAFEPDFFTDQLTEETESLRIVGLGRGQPKQQSTTSSLVSAKFENLPARASGVGRGRGAGALPQRQQQVSSQVGAWQTDQRHPPASFETNGGDHRLQRADWQQQQFPDDCSTFISAFDSEFNSRPVPQPAGKKLCGLGRGKKPTF